MSTKVKLEMKPVGVILARLGIDEKGRVQRFLTETVNKRITRYMPFRTGVLATKLKFVSSPTEITVNGPYARYQYYGEIMVDPKTGAAGFLNKDGQWKSRKGVNKVRSGRPIQYDKTKNARAGPFWDRRMMAAEKDVIVREVQAYVKRGGKT